MFSSTAHSGANAEASSSWKLEASQTTVAPGSALPTRSASGRPTLPATSTGRPAARQMAPSSSTVVVLPLVPVTATNGWPSSSRQASSSSPVTSMPRSSAAATTGADRGTPGLLTTVATRSSRSTPSTPAWASNPPGSSTSPESTPMTSPCGASIRAAARPERFRPTTR